MIVNETILDGVFEIDPELITDDRGFFSRLYCKRDFSRFSLNSDWVQCNNSYNKEERTLRGLHLQTNPFSEVKLVRCISGIIWDVVVDLRVSSKTFGRWHGVELSSANRKMMYVPHGCAHGFITLTNDTEIIYAVSEYYSPAHEKTLLWSDTDVSISWPETPRILSDKDKSGLSLKSFL